MCRRKKTISFYSERKIEEEYADWKKIKVENLFN